MKPRQWAVLIGFIAIALFAAIGFASEVMTNTPPEFVIMVGIFAFVLAMLLLAFRARMK